MKKWSFIVLSHAIDAHGDEAHHLDAASDNHVVGAGNHALCGEVYACCADPHLRSRVTAGTFSGKPAASTACRPMLPDCSATWMTQPAITSSTSSARDSGFRRHRRPTHGVTHKQTPTGSAKSLSDRPAGRANWNPIGHHLATQWQRAAVAQRDPSDDESPRIPFGHAGAGIEQGVRARA
jgi:hypothetical protein